MCEALSLCWPVPWRALASRTFVGATCKHRACEADRRVLGQTAEPRPSGAGVPRLRFPSAGMQDRFGVAVRLGAALEDQIAGRLECNAVEARRHRAVERVAGILPVD